MRVRRGAHGDRAAIGELEGEGLLVTEWTDDPGVHYSEHRHETLEVRVVLEGSMLMEASGQAFELGPGDRVDLEPGEAHRATVGPGGVRFLAGRPPSS